MWPSCFVRVEDKDFRLPLRKGVVAIVQGGQHDLNKHSIYYRAEVGEKGRAQGRQKIKEK